MGVNQNFFEDIIKLVEPIHFPGISVPIDHYNAMLIVSMLVEAKKSLAGVPKDTVQALGKTVFELLKTENKLPQALFIAATQVLHGEVVMGSPDNVIQHALDDIGIFDRWKNATTDWVYPIFTSLSKNKSDRLMERTFTIDHVSTCERSLVLSQKHWYDTTEKKSLQKLAHDLGLDAQLTTLLAVQGGGDNVQYLRFILPPGTQLIPSPADFTIGESTTMLTNIQGYITTHPGTTSTLEIRYTLVPPYCTDKTEFFKQP